jgi:hypothetical protein
MQAKLQQAVVQTSTSDESAGPRSLKAFVLLRASSRLHNMKSLSGVCCCRTLRGGADVVHTYEAFVS